MKKLIRLAVVLLVVSMAAMAEEKVELSSLSLFAGKGALSSWLVFEADFTRGEDGISLILGEKDLEIFYLKSFLKGKFSIGPCLEYFLNTPVIGAIATTNTCKNVSSLTWVGASAGNPGDKITPLDWRFLFFFQSLDVTFKRVTVQGVIMHYNEWQPMLTFKYNQPMTKKVNISINVGYNFYRFHQEFYDKIGLGESAMLGMKVSYNFK